MKIHEQRLQRLHEKLALSKNAVNRVELTHYVFEGDKEMDFNQKLDFAKRKRTEFFKVLNTLRAGSFAENKEKNKNRKTKYKVIYDKKNDTYSYAKGSTIPNLDSLAVDERLTLPLLMGILYANQSLAIASKIYDQLQDKYNISEEEIQSGIAIISNMQDFQNDNTVEIVVELQKLIYQNQRISFFYKPVSLNEKVATVLTYPLQILYHDGLYYLWGISNLKDTKIKCYRIDRITKLKSTKNAGLDWSFKQERDRLKIVKILEHIIGVVPPLPEQKPIKIRLKFFGWAAAYILSAPLHNSMIVQQKEENYCIVQITVYDSFEVAFLLGRFRDYCQVLTPLQFGIDRRVS